MRTLSIAVSRDCSASGGSSRCSRTHSCSSVRLVGEIPCSTPRLFDDLINSAARRIRPIGSKDVPECSSFKPHPLCNENQVLSVGVCCIDRFTERDID